MKNLMQQAWQFVNNVTQKQQRKGFKLTHLHPYTDENGNLEYIKFRLKNNTTNEKYIRSISLDSQGNWQMREPDF